nr:putative metal-dependent phosphohydrolase HD domain protein [Megavirus caiporensis]
MSITTYLDTIQKIVENETIMLMKNHNIAGHGLDHFVAVRDHAINALKFEQLSNEKNLQVLLAAYLHDVDDNKIFPRSIDYQNARKILDDSFQSFDYSKLNFNITYDEFKTGIIQLVSLVSCSKNGDDEPPEKWMAIPRDADRLEAIGEIGVQRCLEYTNHINLPYYLTDTPRAKNMTDINLFATTERFNNYKSGKKSVSMIDHYYDKLLHIGKPNCLRSQNKYILEEAAKRNNIMINYLLNYEYK